jgi:hypothetical protein
MKYAASLLGTTVNCADSMRAGEAGDEEASAASAALTILREIWEGRAFTAKDVVKAMTIEPKIGGWLAPTNGDEIEKARAQAIADALGELAALIQHSGGRPRIWRAGAMST